MRLHHGRVGIRNGVPEVHPLNVNGMYAVVVRRIADCDGDLIHTIGQLKFPFLTGLDVDERVKPLVGDEIPISRLIGMIARPTKEKTVAAIAEYIARVG